MSSKRIKRRRHREAFANYDPSAALPNPPKKAKKDTGPQYVAKLPGQRYVRIGSALLLIGSLLGAGIVWFSLNEIKGLDTQQIIDLTSIRGQSPLAYMISLAFNSISAVVRMMFGFPMFRNARDPFYYKTNIIMCVILIVMQITFSVVMMFLEDLGVQIVELVYSFIIPGFIIYGSILNKKWCQKHPDYVPPEPTQMF